MMVIDPLTVRFSQDRVRPTFQDSAAHKDGLPVQKAVDEIICEPFGDKKNLIFLRAPFEPVEIVKWRAKHYGEDDQGQEDASYGDEKWFTLDNRRLYALQKKAVEIWPQRCMCEALVVTLKEMQLRGGKNGKQLRKFKTPDEGASINVGYRDDEDLANRRRWDWRERVNTMGQMGANPIPRELMEMEPQKMEGAKWYYIATKANEHTIQGPYDIEQMRIWYLEYPKLFTRKLQCKLDWYLEFYPLSKLYSGKSSPPPFTNYPRHPKAELNDNRLQ